MTPSQEPERKSRKARCYYCANEAEPGRIETDNNGPIVPCPVCRPESWYPRPRKDLK